MFASRILRSAEPPMEYAKTIWSPTGGWYTNHPNAVANGLFAFTGISAICYWIYTQGKKYEYYSHTAMGPIATPEEFWDNQDVVRHRAIDYLSKRPSLFDALWVNKSDYQEE